MSQVLRRQTRTLVRYDVSHSAWGPLAKRTISHMAVQNHAMYSLFLAYIARTPMFMAVRSRACPRGEPGSDLLVAVDDEKQ